MEDVQPRHFPVEVDGEVADCGAGAALRDRGGAVVHGEFERGGEHHVGRLRSEGAVVRSVRGVDLRAFHIRLGFDGGGGGGHSTRDDEDYGDGDNGDDDDGEMINANPRAALQARCLRE